MKSVLIVSVSPIPSCVRYFLALSFEIIDGYSSVQGSTVLFLFFIWVRAQVLGHRPKSNARNLWGDFELSVADCTLELGDILGSVNTHLF